MAVSMSSSETSTSRAASPSGMNESAAATRRIGAVEPSSHEPGDDGLADAARLPGLVDDHDPADGPGVAGDLVDRQRGQPAQVEDAARRCPSPASRSATRSDRNSPLPHVTTSTSSPSRATTADPIGTWSRAHRSGAAYGAVQRSSPGSCRSRVW